MLPRKSTTDFFSAILLVVIGLGCKEALPPYMPPQNLTEATLYRASGLGGPSSNIAPIRHHCADYSQTTINVALKNIYHETLEGERYVKVHIEIDGLDPKLPFHRELTHEIIGPRGALITLDPGESYAVAVPWDRRDDHAHLLDTGVDSSYFTDPDSLISPPIDVRLRGSIQVWKQVPPQATNEFLMRMIFHKVIRCDEGWVQ